MAKCSGGKNPVKSGANPQTKFNIDSHAHSDTSGKRKNIHWRLRTFRMGYRGIQIKDEVDLRSPRLKTVTFHTFRHWKSTTEYHKTKDTLHINTKLLYTQLVNFGSDEWLSARAKTTKEAKKLVEAGFEYICTAPEETLLFRKRK